MFQPDCLPILIGSLPLTQHSDAMDLILAHTPDIPLWPQLPKRPNEGMVRQFLTGFPGLVDGHDRFWIDSGDSGFPDAMTAFYEDYILADSDSPLAVSHRFGLADDTAPGFSVFEERLAREGGRRKGVKGQVTGPITVGISVKDATGTGIIYDANLRDMLIKLITMKACWQVGRLRSIPTAEPPILFIDEPGMVSFGSTAFSGISRDLVKGAIAEVIQGIQNHRGLAGIHICANGDWGPALEAGADIISFDAYTYFDNFILYREALVAYLEADGILAWGIVPTGTPEAVSTESVDSLFNLWQKQAEVIASFGIPKQQLLRQTLVAPACGTGSLPLNLAKKVLGLTAAVSNKIRDAFGLAAVG